MSESSNVPEHISLLTNAADGIDTAMLTDLLESQGIPCWAMDSSSGSILRSTLGFSPSGRQIYVEESRLEEARQVMEAFTRGEAGPAEDSEEQPEEEPSSSGRQRSIALWAGVILIILVVILITAGLR